MKISVIIPTYNRAPILTMCLEALEKQSFQRSDFEVIVVDDGSQDKTPSILEQFKKGPLQLTALKQMNQRQGAARNNGLKHAKGEVILFLGDDIIAAPDLLEQHWSVHERENNREIAVLGFIDWHPKLEVNDYMQWMVNGSSIFGKFGGHQFAFEKLKRGEKPDYNFFYTSNLSIKREILGQNPFDLTFSQYGWEDIELGYRLQKEKGLELKYNDHAVGYHYHPLNESGLAKRMEFIGRSAHIIDAKYPELKKVPSLSKKCAFILLSNPLSLLGIRLFNLLTQKHFQALEYYALSKKYFLKGVRAGYNESK